MANVKDFVSKLKSLATAIKAEAPGIAQTMAITGKSLMQERIQREGVPGAAYSDKDVPAWFMGGYTRKDGSRAASRARNQRGEKYLDSLYAKPKKEQRTNWQKFRAAQGLQTEVVDLTYTGRMFGGFVLQPLETSGTRTIARMAGSDQEVDQKLYWNTERYGDFTAPNAAERLEIKEIATDAFSMLIKKYLK